MNPFLGIIEGFYGRTWPMAAREKYAQFLKNAGYSFYIYAPKNDPHLRKSWMTPWPEEHAQTMRQLVQTYHAQGLHLGVGLSPFEIYKHFDSDAQNALRIKLQELNSFGIDLLCLLFDDMRGDLPNLAQSQIEITHFVAQYSQAKRLIMCPTYYSFDPVLEKVFGPMPRHYWQELGTDLDPVIDVFWTGPRVCSEAYPRDHLEQINALLQRPVFLWDNYPVNDGAKISKFLHLNAFQREGLLLRDLTAGHAANPMNQPMLSQIPLLTLPQAYKSDYQRSLAFEDACLKVCGPEMARVLMRDLPLFQELGFDSINRAALTRKYGPFAGHPLVQELLDWLQGGYAFDPACLTD